MKMFDAAQAVTMVEGAARDAGLSPAAIAGFWAWLTEVKFAASGAEMTDDMMNLICSRVRDLVSEYETYRDRELSSWADRIEARDDNGIGP